MTLPQVQQALTPASTALGVVTKTVYVDSVDGPIAIVHDQFGTTFRMRRDVMRAKGDPPMIGDAWIVDKLSVNDWVFSVCMNAPVVSHAIQADVDSLNTQVDVLDERINGLAVCRVALGVDVSMGAATDVFAQMSWTPGSGNDPDGIFYPASTAGPGNSTYSRIVVPHTGRYWLGFKATFNGATSYSAACFITKNTPNSSASIIRDSRNINASAASADRTPPHAQDVVLLQAADILYWGNWQSITGTLLAINANVPTALSLHQLGWR